MSQVAQKALTDKALQCIALARTIHDRYPDPTKISGDDAVKMQNLLKEAQRLRGLADIEGTQDAMESWGREPDQIPAALRAEAQVAAANGVVETNGSVYAETRKARAIELFTKAMRHGWKGQPWVQSLDAAEKADLVEDATGEVIVPHDIAGPIFKTLPHLGTFRAAGPTVRPTTSNKVDLRSLTQATGGWGKLETGGTPATDLSVIPNTPADVVEVHDLLAMSRIGVDELADTDANLVAIIQGAAGEVFAALEDDAFAIGTGTSQPWGLGARASALITQAVTAGSAATPTGDDLKSLKYRVGTRFRQGGAYFASDDASEAVALLKDANSNYLWQPSVRAGEPDTLFGKAFYTMEGLPSMTASTDVLNTSVIFGDLGMGYMVADRQRITVQRLDERYAELGLVAFIFKLRVGGDVMRPAAFAKYLL